ncbi:MAG: hypothetical protein IPK01_08505 [Acidobacteria bacterium]|nr:hypothetical protein [Acidobacteriota bacterium]
MENALQADGFTKNGGEKVTSDELKTVMLSPGDGSRDDQIARVRHAVERSQKCRRY